MRFAPLALILGAVACVVALVAARRRGRWRGVLATPEAPTRLDRGDFAALAGQAAARPWLLAVLTDTSCGTCRGALDRLEPLGGPDVAMVEVDAAGHGELHDRYGVDAVPFTLLADGNGTVQAWILGPPTSADIEAVRRVLAAEGSTPPPQ